MLASERPKIGLAVSDLRALKGPRYGGKFAEFDRSIDEFVAAARERFDVYLLQHARSDARRLKALARTHGATLLRYRDIDDMVLYADLLTRLDLMIGVRLHAIVLGITMGVPTIGIGTANAKQHRLARYEMPTLARQFYSFSMVDRLRRALERISATGDIAEQAISEAEQRRVVRLNDENLELIRSLW
jgi:polysaccharide pyruvyl transferase WcaK-like protein